MKKSLVIIAAFVLAASNFTVNAQSVNWYQAKKSAEEPFNISTDYTYENILKSRTGVPVVVAVIDSGVDIEHEDLKDVIWVNSNEIPDNGIDDDHNGYIDDMHGWNFIGGKDGSQVASDTYEITRLYAKLKQKYENVDPSTLKGRDSKEYETYSSYAKKINKELKSAKKNYEEFVTTEKIFKEVIDLLESVSQDGILTLELADSLATQMNRNSQIAANIIHYYNKELGSIPEVEDIRKEVLDPVEEGLKYYGSKVKYGYNIDYDPRSIVGDNIQDTSERYYGNNSVEGPDAFHGTHVAGIIAAERNNELGINGIANNVKIMVIRAVPDGDERDKDVANAIKYAVENGASIINMSFGKGQSPNKKIVDDAIRYAEKHDVLLVHAAGNESSNLDSIKNYPNDTFIKPKGFLFCRKKEAENFITVGAISNKGDSEIVANFSNYGKENVDVFAPGEYMYSTIPDNKYEISQGTSMAAPVVTGVAAVIRSYFPALSAKQVKRILIDSSVDSDLMVKKPGSEEMAPFKNLSVSGGIIDTAEAIKLAAHTKGKKKRKEGVKA